MPITTPGVVRFYTDCDADYKAAIDWLVDRALTDPTDIHILIRKITAVGDWGQFSPEKACFATLQAEAAPSPIPYIASEAVLMGIIVSIGCQFLLNNQSVEYTLLNVLYRIVMDQMDDRSYIPVVIMAFTDDAHCYTSGVIMVPKAAFDRNRSDNVVMFPQTPR